MAGELNPAAAINYPAATATAIAGEKNNLGPKRQRRPSVRLGEIGGDKPSTNTGLLRPKPPSYKTRPLTNLVNKDEYEFDDDNNDKPAKRPLTNFSINNNNNNNDEEDEEAGDEDEEQQQQHQQQTSQDSGESGDERVFQVWHAHNRRSTRPINNNININNNTSSGGGFRGLDIGVRNWLIDLGLARYAPVFEIHEVDDDVLPFLTLEDLKDMGINAVGSRRKLYAAILNLRKGLS
ncbi:uncharacterized protein LOC141586141 [Silene latifolia]|uniref:uncharacterized protein LOC141586141 n=1 Tax=Silene latifolia TaxID=37657 RepID=UPI003D76CBE4